MYKQQREAHTYSNRTSTHENKIINHIKTKLSKEKAMVTKADKGNTLIVLYISDYNKKVTSSLATIPFRQHATLLIDHNETSQTQSKNVRTSYQNKIDGNS